MNFTFKVQSGDRNSMVLNMISSLATTTERNADLINEIQEGRPSRATLAEALLWRNEDQSALFDAARQARAASFPDEEVEVRSVVEIYNVCQHTCHFCSIAKGSPIDRYVLKKEDVEHVVSALYDAGRRVILLQSGEARSQKFADHLTAITAHVHQICPDMDIILCCGNFSRDQYAEFKAAGATRYVLKFEAANPALYAAVKPSDTLEARIQCLEDLVDLGFHTGSGNIVGLPGQTHEDVVTDLLFLGQFKLAMCSTTVFIPNEKSVFRDQPCGNVDTALNFMALMRLLYPDRLMPTTSALGKARPDCQYWGLMAGANTLTVHDGTPEAVKPNFPIYSTHRFTPGSVSLLDAARRANLNPAPKGLIHANYLVS